MICLVNKVFTVVGTFTFNTISILWMLLTDSGTHILLFIVCYIIFNPTFSTYVHYTWKSTNIRSKHLQVIKYSLECRGSCFISVTCTTLIHSYMTFSSSIVSLIVHDIEVKVTPTWLVSVIDFTHLLWNTYLCLSWRFRISNTSSGLYLRTQNCLSMIWAFVVWMVHGYFKTDVTQACAC